MKPITSKRRGCGYWFRLLSVGLVGGLMLACLGIEVIYIIWVTRPAPTSICCATPADLDLAYEQVTLTSGDGVILSGWYIPSRNKAAVILLHGYGANRTEMLGRAGALARHGYGVLLYDLRAHGESGGDWRTYGWLDVKDVDAALVFLQNRADLDPERIGILGFSIGGQIALRAAAQSDRLKAVVADDPGFVKIEDAPPPTSLYERVLYLVNWIDTRGIELRTGVTAPPGVVEVIDDIAPQPLLLIATGQDLGRRLVRHFYDRAHMPKMLWEIPEASHGEQFAARPEEYEQRVVAFFDQALLK